VKGRDIVDTIRNYYYQKDEMFSSVYHLRVRLKLCKPNDLDCIQNVARLLQDRLDELETKRRAGLKSGKNE